MNFKFSRVLSISDNPKIIEAIAEINHELTFSSGVHFHYGTSPFSKVQSFNSLLLGDVKVVDLRIKQQVEDILASYDLVISVHCKQIFPANLVSGVKCINIHPGYNPINRGWYPQVFAIINDLDIGATIHEIDEELDHGGIIDRVKVKKFDYDTSFSLYNRIVDAEIDLWRKNIQSILSAEYAVQLPEEEGVLFLKKDFKSLLKLDLSEKTTFKQAIDRLRALSFDGYRNAYFIDADGKKIFVEIKLSPE